MKIKAITKISAVVASSLLIVTTAHAATAGAYIGGDLGYGRLAIPAATTTTAMQSVASETQKGIAGGAFAGYNFNKNWGLETAYTAYTSATNNVRNSDAYWSFTDSYKEQYQAVSLVGKAYLPVQDNLDLYALAGVAAAAYTASDQFSTQNFNDTVKVSTFRMLPEAGFGAEYRLNTNLSAGLEFSHIQGQGDMNKEAHAIPNADLLTFRLGYHFA